MCKVDFTEKRKRFMLWLASVYRTRLLKLCNNSILRTTKPKYKSSASCVFMTKSMFKNILLFHFIQN